MGRIGLVCDSYPTVTSGGGIGTYTRCVGQELAALGHEVHVFHLPLRPTPLYPETTRDGALIVHSSPGCTERLEAVRRLPRWIDAVAMQWGAFDFVECPEFGGYGLYLERGERLHNWGVRLHTSTRIARLYNQTCDGAVEAIDRLEHDAYLRAAIHTAPSRAIIDETAKHWGIDTRSVACIPNPMAPLEIVERAAPSGRDVLFWGRLEYRKGVDLIAPAFGRIYEAFPDVTFTFIGPDARWPTGERGTELIRRKQREQGIPEATVRLAPALPSAFLHRAIRQCAVAALPSRFENHPYSVLEAMALAKPVVSCAAGGIPEIVTHGITGLLARPDDPDGITGSILDVLKHPERAARMGQEARQWVVASCHPRDVAHRLLRHWGISR